MDQPFAPLVKELFEPQRYPDLRETPNGPPILPYDVAGWTLPMQMGVESAVVLQPVIGDQRSGLRLLEQVGPLPGSVQGTGAAYVISHRANIAFKAINEVLAAGGKVGFSTSEVPTSDGQQTGAMVVTGIDRERMAEIARKNSIVAQAMANTPVAARPNVTGSDTGMAGRRLTSKTKPIAI